jgi:hypothetical protein
VRRRSGEEDLERGEEVGGVGEAMEAVVWLCRRRRGGCYRAGHGRRGRGCSNGDSDPGALTASNSLATPKLMIIIGRGIKTNVNNSETLDRFRPNRNRKRGARGRLDKRMESLIALLLVSHSANTGPALVFRWPPTPASSPRLARADPRNPERNPPALQADNPWKAANSSDTVSSSSALSEASSAGLARDDGDHLWSRPPDRSRDHSLSDITGTPHPLSAHPSSRASGRTSPINLGPSHHDTQDSPFHSSVTPTVNHLQSSSDNYHRLLGYSAEFLAGLLCPTQKLCHQKFELIVDDLAFIGHPVCAEKGATWKFKTPRTDKHKPSFFGRRGRGLRKSSASKAAPVSAPMTPLLDVDPPTPVADDEGSSDSDSSSDPTTAPNSPSSWLQTFHFILVLDLPDPSSSASGNVSKYFDIIYEHIAFTVTAVLYQEQVLSNYVEQESDLLINLKEQYASRGERFADYVEHALRVSGLAQAMKNLYESIKAGVIANITIHDLPLELQLPPYLDSLLHSTSYDDYDDDFALEYQQHEESFFGTEGWGKELSFAWRLPTLAPWKSLLLLDDEERGDGNARHTDLITGQNVIPEDRQLAEQLIRFLELTDITLSCVFSLSFPSPLH